MSNVKVYLWTTCPYCLRACSLLDEQGIAYDKIVLDGKDAELKALRNQTGHRTVPQIFINGEFIGGCSELEALEASGDLLEMVGS